MSDLMSAVGSVRQLATTLSDLGPALSNAAPNGTFSSVLSQVNAELAAANDGGMPPVPASGPVPSTVSLLDAAGANGTPEQVTAGSAGAPTGDAVVADAERYLGVPYAWGGTDPATGLDCSGLVQRVYGDLGVDLPRTSQEQAQVGAPVASLADAQPGDLVFFAGADGTDSAPGHVGIYMGDGMMIDAPHTGAAVRIEPVGQPVAVRRVLAAGAGGPSTGPGGAAGPTSAGMAYLGVPAGLQPLFESAGQRYGIDPLLLASVAKQESGFQAGALSPAGAVGLMQLMPATAAGLGVDPSDPASAIDGAAQLLSGYLARFDGSLPLALAAYNAGPNAVARYGSVPPYGQTEGYVASISAMLATARAAESAVTA